MKRFALPTTKKFYQKFTKAFGLVEFFKFFLFHDAKIVVRNLNTGSAVRGIGSEKLNPLALQPASLKTCFNQRRHGQSTQ